jgi:SAM-dependent methyltransferase
MKRNIPLTLGIWDRLPSNTQKKLRRLFHPAWFGILRKTTPISSHWGFDRGTPIDRYYVEQFLQRNRQDIHGQVGEVGNRTYTDRYGVNVEHCDVLDNNPANPQANLLIDLESPTALPSNHYDCLVLTQVLQFIYNLQPSLEQLHRSLRPGGVILATVPCVSRLDLSYGTEKDYWRFTAAVCKILFGEVFGADHVNVYSLGNFLVSVAFLAGVAAEELSIRELGAQDELFQFLIAVRAVKE